MARTELWMQLGVRIFEKFEIIHMPKSSTFQLMNVLEH